MHKLALRLKSDSGELLNIDAMRLIAALGIVFLHTSEYFISDTASRNVLHHKIQPLALFVDLFFIISGYVIAYTSAHRVGTLSEYLFFLKKRVARLIPLHWVVLVFFVFVGILIMSRGMHINHPEIFDYSCLAYNVFLINAIGLCNHLTFNGVSWSIGAEFVMYITFPIYLSIKGVARTAFIVLPILILVLLFILRTDFTQLHWSDWTAEYGALRALPSFMFGIALYYSDKLLKKIPTPGLLIISFFSLFIAGIILTWPTPALICLIYLLAASAIAGDVQSRVSRIARYIAPYGRLTYSLYMIHPVVIVILYNFILDHFLHAVGLPRVLIATAGELVILTAAYLSYEYYETPMRKWITRLGNNKIAVPTIHQNGIT